VADSHSVPDLALLLKDQAVRDEARMELEQIPGDDAGRPLASAERHAPNDFQPALKQSVRARSLTLRTVGAESPEERG
jgi:hypothetical protein